MTNRQDFITRIARAIATGSRRTDRVPYTEREASERAIMVADALHGLFE